MASKIEEDLDYGIQVARANPGESTWPKVAAAVQEWASSEQTYNCIQRIYGQLFIRATPP